LAINSGGTHAHLNHLPNRPGRVSQLVVGGNIKGYSRVLTTATVMETGRGNFDTAIALSIILLLLAFLINYLLTRIQQRERPR